MKMAKTGRRAVVNENLQSDEDWEHPELIGLTGTLYTFGEASERYAENETVSLSPDFCYLETTIDEILEQQEKTVEYIDTDGEFKKVGEGIYVLAVYEKEATIIEEQQLEFEF